MALTAQQKTNLQDVYDAIVTSIATEFGADLVLIEGIDKVETDADGSVTDVLVDVVVKGVVHGQEHSARRSFSVW